MDTTPALEKVGKCIPRRWRWAHRTYASAFGFFWAPCPLCARMFGGHEWYDIDGKPSMIYPDPRKPSHGKGICPWCTRADRGRRQPGISLDDLEEHERAREASGEGRLIPQVWIDEQHGNVQR